MSDSFIKEQSCGKIIINSSVLAQLVEREVASFGGRVIITNSKGKRLPFLYRSVAGEDRSNIDISIKGEKIDIKIHVIIKLGLSISKTTQSLIRGIKTCVEKAIGVSPASVTVIVAGVLSKQMARRNIEVKKQYGIDEYE